MNPETYPAWAHVIYQFPARGDMVPVTFNWYEGKKDGKTRVLPPEALLSKVLKPGQKLSDSGSILVGDQGILYSPTDYGESFTIFDATGAEIKPKVERTLPRNGGGDGGMKREWVNAIMAGQVRDGSVQFHKLRWHARPRQFCSGMLAVRAAKKLELRWADPDVHQRARGQQAAPPRVSQGLGTVTTAENQFSLPVEPRYLAERCAPSLS